MWKMIHKNKVAIFRILDLLFVFMWSKISCKHFCFNINSNERMQTSIKIQLSIRVSETRRAYEFNEFRRLSHLNEGERNNKNKL